jgi:CRP-like cAMP-binding protein
MVSRRPALERVALLLLDIICRIEGCSRAAVGDRKVDLPITQEHMADALGLTPIHVNRMLQKLRKAGILSLEHGVLRILDLERITNHWGFEHEVDGHKVYQSGHANVGNLG